MALQQKIVSETGGISSGTYIYQTNSSNGTTSSLDRMSARSKAMVSKLPALFDLFWGDFN